MQYFHPDNMSSAENMKLELAKVRDEFKMSESDCGSARVQGIEIFILSKFSECQIYACFCFPII